MARIRLALPGEYIFSTRIPVRIGDINYGGHLGNDAILSIMHEARLQFLNQFGFTELDVGGASLIMADSAIVYKSEGFHGQVISIEMNAVDFSNSGFDLFYRLTNSETGKEIAVAKTGMVCFNYDSRKVVPVPPAFREKFSAALNGE